MVRIIQKGHDHLRGPEIEPKKMSVWIRVWLGPHYQDMLPMKNGLSESVTTQAVLFVLEL